MNQRTFVQRVKQLLAPVLVALAAAGKWIVAGAKWILPALKFVGPFLKTGGTMLVSIFAYGMVYGWQFGVGIVLLIFVHECGHLLAARMMGLNVGWPVFIPFMGAIIALKEAPRNAWVEAVVGIGGPLLGSAGAFAVLGLYFVTWQPLFLVLGYVGLMLNLFNMIPIVPLDGGRIVTAVSPWLWVVGIIVIVPYLLLHASPVSLIILFIVIMSLPRVWALFRGSRSPEAMRYFECRPAQRWTMALLYFGLLGTLGWTMRYLHGYLNRLP